MRKLSSLRLTISTAAVSLGLTSTPALAQDISDSGDQNSEQAGFAEIVVTARRRAETIQDVPVAVSVLTAATLESRGVHSEADLQLAI